MNVHRDIASQPLRRVLDNDRWPLHAEIGLAGFERSAPGEPGVGEVGSDFLEFRGRRSVVNDAGPFNDEFEEQLALWLIEGGGLERRAINVRGAASGPFRWDISVGADVTSRFSCMYHQADVGDLRCAVDKNNVGRFQVAMDQAALMQKT